MTIAYEPTAHPRPLVLLASRETGEMRDIETALFSAGYRVVTARNAHETLQKARNHQPDAIILDAALDVPTFELCQSLRQDPSLSPASPIMLTRAHPGTRAERIEALRAGAWDLQADSDLEELLLRLSVYLQAKTEVDLLTTECLVDRGTGLYNAHGFTQRAEELGALATRQGLAAACAVFRPTEELPTRATSDKLGLAFKTIGRLSDAIGRTEHTEFAIFAPATDAWAAARLVRRLSDRVIEEVGYVPEKGKRIALRSGYSAVPAGQKISAVALLARARTTVN